MGTFVVRRDHPIYQRTVKAEAAVWGKIKWNPDAPLSAQPAVAEYENELITGQRSQKMWDWLDVLQRRYGSFDHVLSLGSGVGAFESELLIRGLTQRLDIVDISQQACEKARQRLADELGVEMAGHVSVIVQDLNFADLPAAAYDLVIARGILHHIINLEHLIYQIGQALTSDGRLLIYEYIGEDQWQFTDERLGKLKSLLESEAETEHLGALLRRPQRLPSPFEAVRSSEIHGLLDKVFLESTDMEVVYGGVFQAVALCVGKKVIVEGLAQKRDVIQKDILLRKLVRLDRYATQNRLVDPCCLFAIYRKPRRPIWQPDVRMWTDRETWQRLDERSQMLVHQRIRYELRKIRLLREAVRRVRFLVRQH